MPPGWCDCCFCNLVEKNNLWGRPRAAEREDPGAKIMGGEIVQGKADFERRYEFIKTLGDGGQGGVYKYRRRADGALVAVKEFGCLTAKYVPWRLGVCGVHVCCV